jgi:hypothetical protein
MTSARLVLAAQTNGRKSRGPKSAAGRRRSSANAVKHGFYGKTLFFDAGYKEDLQAIQIAFTAEYQPQNDFETQLIRNYAQAEAAHQWAIRAEAGQFDRVLATLPPETTGRHRLGSAAIALCRILSRIHTLEFRFERRASQLLGSLLRLRSHREINKIWTQTNPLPSAQPIENKGEASRAA